VLHVIQCSSGSANGTQVAMLATGSSDSCLRVWSIRSAHDSNTIAPQAELATLAAANKSSDQGTAQIPATLSGPVTSISSVTEPDGGVLLAAVCSDGRIHTWQGTALGTEAPEWRKNPAIEVHRGIIQHCVAFSHIPGHPDWCVHFTMPVCSLQCTVSFARQCKRPHHMR
jgi:WD40 repeat protein